MKSHDRQDRWPRRDFLKAGVASLVGSGILGCSANDGPFPSKPIKIVVPYGSGGGTDLETRALAPYVQQQLGRPIVIENQPGADGRLALSRFARETSDGYTLAVYGIPSIILGEMLLDTPYSVRDFSHIYAWIRESQVLVTKAGRWKNFDAFMSEARRSTLSVGTTYLTSSGRLAGLILEQEADLEFSWIPFGSNGAALAALLGTHVDFCITASTTCLSLVQSGDLEPLLVFSESQDHIYPDTPTPGDRGFSLNGLPIVRGVVGPPGLEPARLNLLGEAFARAVEDPGFVTQARNTNTPLHPMTATEYREQVDSYYDEIEPFRDILLQIESEG